jgi:hypothetical protein
MSLMQNENPIQIEIAKITLRETLFVIRNFYFISEETKRLYIKRGLNKAAMDKQAPKIV